MSISRPGAPLEAHQFFSLVEKHLGSAMSELGYLPIQGSVNDDPESRSTNSANALDSDEPPFRLFEYGYEAGRGELKRLIRPDDPESADELWVSYEPATGLLDLRDWEHVPRKHIEGDTWLDPSPCTPAEVRMRLQAVGQAVRGLVQDHRSGE